MNRLIAFVKKIRASLMRMIKPRRSYYIVGKNLKPISYKFGYDRGKPIDRFWIEDFLNKNKSFIKGNCLEITDCNYTKLFGGKNVVRCDVLDINRKNLKANIYGDIRNLHGVIKANTYDCIILTHVLGLIDDMDAAISELRRILKPGGSILVTSSCISPTYDLSTNYWRILPGGARYMFERHFGKGNVKVGSFGNVLAGQYFWVGMSQEDLTEKELTHNDPKFPCIVTVIAQKKI